MFKSALALVLIVASLVVVGVHGRVSAEEAAQPALPRVEAARLSMAPDRARLILDLSGTTEFAVASLDKPNRVVVDVRASSVGFDKPSPVAGEGLVSDYTVEMAEPGRARATLVLAETAEVQQAYVLPQVGEQPARLVVDLIPTSAANFTAKVAADLAAARAGAAHDKAAATDGGSPTVIAGSKPLIVIDPGHGGIDSGARASHGAMEKNLVLQFSLKLQHLLVESGRFDVALTRTDDTYLTLRDRVNLARQNRASLFVSIHADTFDQPSIRGFSIYTRDENATDELDKVLADKENSADLVAGYTDSGTPPRVVNLLVDLMRRQTRRQSYLAAETIVDHVTSGIKLRKFPVRQADFFVLQAPDVPSILIELGFLSNPEDIAELKTKSWQEKAAEAVAEGIAAYFDAIEIPERTAAQ